MFYYLSRGSLLFLMLGVFAMLTSCAPQSEVDDLKSELEKMRNPQAPVVQPSTPVQQPPTVIYTPAPVVKTPPAPAFGTGNGNNMMTPVEGYLTIQTKSADGKLTLRSNPSQNGASIIEIPNGTSGIYYNSRVQTGDHVWYYAFYNGSEGWLRGDYIDIY